MAAGARGKRIPTGRLSACPARCSPISFLLYFKNRQADLLPQVGVPLGPVLVGLELLGDSRLHFVVALAFVVHAPYFGHQRGEPGFLVFDKLAVAGLAMAR